MARPFDIETFKELLRDPNELHLAIGKIKKLGVASDRSVLRVQVSIMPEEREIIAMMTWETVGIDAGDFRFPKVDDLVLVGFVEKDPNQAFILRRLTSKTDTIPAKALLGHRVIQTEAGAEEIFIASDERINLAKRNSVPLEPLVLGLVAQQYFSDELTQLSTLADEVGTLADKASSLLGQVKDLVTALTTFAGALTVEAGAGASLIAALAPITAMLPTIDSDIQAVSSAAGEVKDAVDSLKESPIEDATILSDLAFTEKG